MFPLDFPYQVLKDVGDSDKVLDPFCGRGTTNFAARLRNTQSLGIDSSQVAISITEAKVVDTSPDEIVRAAQEALDEVAVPNEVPDSEFWELAYHRDVLRLISRLRESLLRDSNSDARKALRAIIMGALHGPRNKYMQTYFSNQSPRTYAPKPRYAVKYWKKNGLSPEKVDVLSIVAHRAQRYYSKKLSKTANQIIRGDSRSEETYKGIRDVTWIITSPPYYGMYTYIPDQWLRNWFVGGADSVDYSSQGQLKHTTQDVFVTDLNKVWKNTSKVAAPDAKMIIRYGGINDRKANSLEIIHASLANSGWSVLKVESAGSASKGRRQAKYFIPEVKTAQEEFDIWAVLE